MEQTMWWLLAETHWVIKHWHWLLSIYIKYHSSINMVQQGAIAANEKEHRDWGTQPNKTKKKTENRLLPQCCFPSWPWGGCTPPLLPVGGGSYLGCSRGDRALLAWVDCLCLDRKDWAGPGAVEHSHRLCCCRAEDCKRQKTNVSCSWKHSSSKM